METWRERFRRRFQELQAEESLTQEKLAEQMGITQGTVGHWLTGRRSPKSLDAYETLAAALRVHPAWLLYGIDHGSVDVTEAAQRLNSLPSERRAALLTLINGT